MKRLSVKTDYPLDFFELVRGDSPRSHGVGDHRDLVKVADSSAGCPKEKRDPVDKGIDRLSTTVPAVLVTCRSAVGDSERSNGSLQVLPPSGEEDVVEGLSLAPAERGQRVLGRPGRLSPKRAMSARGT